MSTFQVSHDVRRPGRDDDHEVPRPRSDSSHPVERPSPRSTQRAIVQAKLSVGPVNDPHEREADAVASRVVRLLRNGSAGQVSDEPTEPRASRVQRTATATTRGGEQPLAAQPDANRHPASVGTRIQRRGDRQRRNAMGQDQMAPIVLDLAMEELRTSAELALSGIEQQTRSVVDEQSSRAANRIAGSFETSENVVNQVLSMAGLDKAKGLEKLKKKRRDGNSKKRAKKDPTGIDAKLEAYKTRANQAMAEAERRRIESMNLRTDLNDTEEYRRQLLVNKQRKRSGIKEKQVNKKDKSGNVKKVYTGPEQVKQAGDVEYIEEKKTGFFADRSRAKTDKKLTKADASQVTQTLGVRFLRQSDIFRRAVSDFGMKVGTSVKTALSPVESEHHADLLATLARAGQQATAVRNAVAAGTMSGDDARRQAALTGERAKAIAGVGDMPNGFVARYTQKIALISTTAADAAYDSLRDPTIRDFEERVAQSMRKVRQQDEDGGYNKLGGLEKKFDTDLGAVSSEDDKSVKAMRDEFRAFVTDPARLTDEALADVAAESVDLGFQKDLKSVFQVLANQGVPNPDKAGTLGSNKSLSITVTIPVDPTGIGRLELEFAVTGSCYPDGNLWVQSRVMIKGGAEPPIPGVTLKAMLGLGFYLEAGSKTHDRLGTLMSFALFRRFRESALVPHQVTDHMWGRSAKAGLDKGQWVEKTAAKSKHANQWGRAVEESFEDDEYAESGGLVRAEVKAAPQVKLGGMHGIEAGGSLEYQRGTRYTKKSMTDKRAKHEQKFASGKYKKGTAHTTGFGDRERGIGEVNNRFTFASNAAVGPFSAAFSASWWGAEREWWIDTTIAATGGDFAGDPASVAARVATWASQMAASAGQMIVQGDEKRRKGQTVDHKDLKALKKTATGVTELGGTLQSLITGTWSQQHAAWEQTAIETANAPAVTRSPTDVSNAWNNAGANHDGSGLVQVQDPTGLTGTLGNQINQHAINSGAKKLLGQGTAAVGAGLGIGKAKSLKMMMRVIGRPGEGRTSEIQFHILNEKSKSVNLLDIIGATQTKDFPIFYAQLPSRKVVWMGGISRDQVKRAVQHQKEVVEVASRHVPGGSLVHKAVTK